MGRPGRRRTPAVATAQLGAALVTVAAGCGGGASSPAQSHSTSPSPAPTTWADARLLEFPGGAVAPSIAFPIAVATRFDDPRPKIEPETLRAEAALGRLLVPCEISGATLDGLDLLSGTAPCLPAMAITAALGGGAASLALLPPGLVSPSVKVLPIGRADLFGGPGSRSLPYPLLATLPMPGGPNATDRLPGWWAYDATQVRTLISTGDTCPDRGTSHQTVVLGKGWQWAFAGGTAGYRTFRHSFWHWAVPVASRNPDAGATAALLADHDVAVNDYECPTIAHFSQHDTGTRFTIDPRFPAALAEYAGVDAVTIGSNHMNDFRGPGISQTIAALDAAGIAHTGAGMNLEEALAPAVVDVRGVRFAFVGWDAGNTGAGPSTPGVARLTSTYVCRSLQAARRVADVVVAMPQWGFPEYHSTMTAMQRRERELFYSCGADHILGSGTHVTSWAGATQGPNGPRFAIGSHGNFLFDQDWSRQTMEGVIVELTFVGTRLVQFRPHPYVIVDNGQPNLIDPLTDGRKVLSQLWHPTEFVCCRP